MKWHWALYRHAHDGIPIRTISEAPAPDLPRVIEALDLIRDLDPRTHRLIKRLLEGGVAVAEPHWDLGWYDLRRKACFLSLDHVMNHAIEEIALTIVHEICHARIEHWQIDYHEDQRLRIEQVCKRREFAFARLLVQHDPEGPDYVDLTHQRLAALAAEDYSDDAFRERWRKSALTQLRYLKTMDIPRWLRRWIVLGARWRLRKHRREGPTPSTGTEPG